VKHRFGPTGELGLFEMTDTGLAGVDDPSGLFLGDRSTGGPGSVVVPTLEGQRPLLVEVQALVAPSDLVMPRRLASGLDANRLALLAAVLHRRVGLSLAKLDVYASAVGGVRLTEPAADLALGLALASAATDVAVPDGLVVCGEVGLAGELRQVAHTQRRLAEAARLGFHRAVVPASAPDPPPGVAVTRVATLAEAVVNLGLRGHGPAGERRPAAEGRAPAERRRSAGERPPVVELPVEGAATGAVAPSPRRRWAANGAVA
jgi:DNA repair protein RadA/Sms